MSQLPSSPDEKRLVNYTGLVQYLKTKGQEFTDKGLRSRISRGTLPSEPARPAPGSNSRLMFDLDKVDAWLAGAWRKTS
jgi:hypothetical protein